MLPDLQNILEALIGQGVDFVIIGGMAAVAQGAPITTFDLDILGELLGGITYDDVLAGSPVLELFGHPVKVMGLRDVIRTKEALRRPKDAAALEILRETLRVQGEKKAADGDT